MPQDEKFEWKKLAKGFFVGKNWWKAFVFSIMAVTIWATVFCIYSYLSKKMPSHKQETQIEGNTGVINQADNHSTSNEAHYHFPLSDLFSFGSKGKKVDDGR